MCMGEASWSHKATTGVTPQLTPRERRPSPGPSALLAPVAAAAEWEVWKGVAMSFTGASSLDHSIGKAEIRLLAEPRDTELVTRGERCSQRRAPR